MKTVRAHAASALASFLLAAALGLTALAQTTATVTPSVVTVSNRSYTVYDYADPATKKFCVVIPRG